MGVAVSPMTVTPEMRAGLPRPRQSLRIEVAEDTVIGIPTPAMNPRS
jgi:uncharacterized protein YbbK (DUF523 family)